MRGWRWSAGNEQRLWDIVDSTRPPTSSAESNGGGRKGRIFVCGPMDYVVYRVVRMGPLTCRQESYPPHQWVPLCRLQTTPTPCPLTARAAHQPFTHTHAHKHTHARGKKPPARVPRQTEEGVFSGVSVSRARSTRGGRRRRRAFEKPRRTFLACLVRQRTAQRSIDGSREKINK